MVMDVRIGVLALQGDFAAHLRALARIGTPAIEVRYAGQLDGLDGLVIPGGESTTLLRLIGDARLEDPLRLFHRRGGAVLGTCAGAILMARNVLNPSQISFDFIDLDVERNAYGRQKESFETRVSAAAFGDEPLEMVFIRAPRFRRVGGGVEVLAARGGEPVMVRQGRSLAAAFHPELSGDGRVHTYFRALAAECVATAS
jgi:pyridoxal 5'-phosphate synthase pdxT subunit